MLASKFEPLFVLKIIFGIVLLTVFFFVGLYFLIKDGQYISSNPGPAVVFGLILLSIYAFIVHLKSIARLYIHEDGIWNVTVLGNRKTLIPYQDIVEEQYDKIRSQYQSEFKDEGYSVTHFVLKNKYILEISANEYENYADLVREIRARRPSDASSK